MRWFVLMLGLILAGPLAAVEPSEMLADPVLEARAQALDAQLRCVRCRSENLASSRSDWASDARILVRELIAEGKTDAEVLAFFQARYGDYVLMDPPRRGANLVLWFAAPVLALFGLGAALAYVRSRRRLAEAPVAGLSPAEQARLDALMDEE